MEMDKADSVASNQGRFDTLKEWISKLGKKADSYTHGVCEHVRLGPKVSVTVKGKLRLGARVLQESGVEKLFKRIFKS
ncbi:putative GEM-like protein 8 [Macadamia integrifolia]|uniref:putative GEM-like protein 8 n=1 Tax=Macadamia integrifolia TaxID=60698 RepID=UPI001C4F985F|nr:putative GEM-like protein 8 [Macadamia integrifolia]